MRPNTGFFGRLSVFAGLCAGLSLAACDPPEVEDASTVRFEACEEGFTCAQQQFLPGIYADIQADCQVSL